MWSKEHQSNSATTGFRCTSNVFDDNALTILRCYCSGACYASMSDAIMLMGSQSGADTTHDEKNILQLYGEGHNKIVLQYPQEILS